MRWIAGIFIVTTIGFAGWISVQNPALAQPTPVNDGPHDVIRFQKGQFQTWAEDGWTDLTAVTTYCLECHGNGQTDGPARDEASAPEPSHELGGLGRSHPVDVEYPVGGNGYLPIEELDEKIILVDGRLTCLTCHAATVDRSLVLPTKAGTLCIACHEM